MAITLTGVRVWDGLADEVSQQPWCIRIEGDRISALGPDPRLADGAQVLDFKDQFAIPGLMDAHVHLTLDEKLPSWKAQTEVPAEARIVAMRERAVAMLAAGITTARDLGAGEWKELELRDRIAAGETPGPRLLCVGQPLTTARGHCHFWGGVVENDDQIANVIARQLERRVEWIKVMATGGVFTEGSSSSDTQFSLEQLEKIVGGAREHGRSVAAHCHGTHGIELAARAGVRTIEHCSFAGQDGFGTDLDPRVVDLLVEAGAWVSPTVNVGWMRRLHAAEDRGDDPNELPFFQRMSRALRALRDAGVPFVASTDAGIPGVAHDRLAEGLVGLRRYAGLEPIDVLRAATSNAARALGIEGETGSLVPGLSADIVIVDADPTQNLATLKKPRAVIARGVLAERPDDPAAEAKRD